MGMPTLRVDPELARIAVGLNLASQFRLWVVARHLTRIDDGSSKVSKRDLKATLSDYHITYTRQYFNSLIRAGEGVFWNIDRDTLYIRSGQFVAKQLTQQALEQSPDLLLNKAGVQEVLLSPSGSLEQWQATIYAGWLAHREDPTISRVALEKLFNRSADTLREWERTCLKPHLKIRSNYAQCAFTQTWEKVQPDPTFTYIARTQNGEQARFIWQLPNTYITKGIKIHQHRGQSKKVRQAVNKQLQQPANHWRGGSPVCKLYFDSAKMLRSHLKKHDGIYYLWRGKNRHQHGIYEATETGWAETSAKERASFRHERAIKAGRQVRIQL